MIKIVVDSTCSPSEEYIKSNGIIVNPLRILFEDKEYIENNSLYDEIYLKMDKTKEIPKTSQPSLESYINIFDEIANNGDEAIVLTLSQTLSGTYNCACLARQNCVAPEKIHVIDSQSIGQTVVGYVYEIVEMIKQNKNIQEIVTYIERLRKNSAITFIPESFENLKKNGRIGNVKAIVATLLKIKPIILFKEGVLSGDKKAIGMTLAIGDMAKQVPHNTKRLFIIKAGIPDYFEKFKEKMLNLFRGFKVEFGTVSPVVGAHVGQSIGLAWVAEEK